MKKIVIFLCLIAALGAAAAASPDVNEKVLKAFRETFVKATDVVWYENQNVYEASFKQSQILTRVIYDKKGNLLDTRRYYYEENLPVHILTKLKKAYPGKSVFGVTELSNGDQISYYITLEDEKNWYIIESDNLAQLNLMKKFNKA